MRECLKEVLDVGDNQNEIRFKMILVCAGSGLHLHSMVEELLSEYAVRSSKIIDYIEESGLTDFLWKIIGNDFSYCSSSPSVKDFSI